MNGKIDKVVSLFLNQDIWREPFKVLDCKRFDDSDFDKLDYVANEFLISLSDLGVESLPTKDDFIAAIEKEVRGWR
jgi:hypothetical protein